MRGRRLVRILLFWLVAGVALSAHPALAKHIQAFTLANDLKVLIVEEHKAPVVSVQVWYRVGSRNEAAGQTGLSHLVEHMMFKGTTAHGKGEFSRIIAKHGGTENAFTGKDYTAYFENISSTNVTLALELEADRMRNLLMDPDEFLLERDVVKEERRLRTEDDPYALLAEKLYAAAFHVHPYRTPIIGWMEDLNRLSRGEALAYYQRFYVPNNAVLVIVGDIATKTLLPKIRRLFEDIPAGPPPPQVVSAEPAQRGERRIIVKKEAQLPFVYVGYRAPNYRSRDAHALTVLARILASGKSSRLYQQLVYQQKLALEVGGQHDSLSTDPDLLTLYAVAQAGKTASEVEEALLAEVERIRTGLVSDRELQKAKNQVEAEFILSQDSNFFVAMQVGMMETVGAGYQYFESYVEEARAVTAGDVQRVAREYLTEDNRTVGILWPLERRSSEPSKESAP